MLRIPAAVVWLALCALLAMVGFQLGQWTAQPVPATAALVLGQAVPAHLAPLPAPMPAAVDASANTPAIPNDAAQVQGTGKPSYLADWRLFNQIIDAAKTNPAAAMQQVAGLRGPLRQQAEFQIVSLWAERDSNGVWLWLSANRADNTALFIHALEAVARVQPNVATAYAEQLLNGHRELRRDIYQALITGLGQGGAYLQAVQVVEKISLEPESTSALLHQILETWGLYDPQGAMQWLSRQSDDDKARYSDQLMKSWAAGDPQLAVAAAQSLTGEMRVKLLETSFPKWLAQDAAAASSWLMAQPSSKNLDALFYEVIESGAVKSQPQQALAWAEKITNDEQRLGAITGILSLEKQQNEAAALAHLKSLSTLSDAQRAQLYNDLAFKSSY